MASTKRHHKEKMIRRKEDKQEEPEVPKYRDCAKERREDQNPDYEPTELGSFHAVAPPGTVDLRTADAHKIFIENRKYLGVYQWIVKPHSVIKPNEMFLPGRMAFIFNMEDGFSHDIPTTLHRSKADCPIPEEMVTVSADGSVLDLIAKIMSYLHLGSSGKVLKKRKKRCKRSGWGPPLYKKIARSDHPKPIIRDPQVQSIRMRAKPGDMEDSPRNNGRPSYFSEPVYGPVPPRKLSQDWQQTNGYDAIQTQVVAASYHGEWQDYQYAEQLAYPEQYFQQNLQEYDLQAGTNASQDPRFMTQQEKDRGLGSVFKCDDQRLQQLREKDVSEKDPNFISESYSECYPGYQEYNRKVVDSDDEADLSKMDMGGRAKGHLHRWDFETEEEWARYNDQKGAMPKAAFQFGVKMQDGRKTRKQNKDQKITNELHKINKILARKKMEKGEDYEDGGHYDDDLQPAKKLLI